MMTSEQDKKTTSKSGTKAQQQKSSSSKTNSTSNNNNNKQRSLEEERRRISEVEYLNIQDDEFVAEEDELTTTRNNRGGAISSSQSAQVLAGAAANQQQQSAVVAPENTLVDNDNDVASSPTHHQYRIDSNSSGGGFARSESTRRLMTLDDDDGDGGNTVQSLRKNLTKNLLWAVVASTVGSSFQHGYNIGVTNAPEKLIGQFINETYFKRHHEVASEGQIDLILAIMVSIYCVGGCIGALFTAFVADRIGRKEGLFYNNVLVLLACPMMASARSLSSYELLIFGRLIIGINAGLNAGLAPLYLSEISPTSLRGALGTIYQLVITISILLSNIFGLPGLFGTLELWPFLFALPLIPAAFMLVSLPHICESPKHLLLNNGHELQAQQALAWLRETGEIQDEMDDLRAENEKQKLMPPVTLRQLLNQGSFRKPLTISVVIMLSQQFSGINAVLFFSTSIFRDAGLDQAAALKATLGMSLTNVLMTIVSLFLVDRAGRKTLHMTGLMGMAVTCLILAVCLGGGSSAANSQAPHTCQASSLIAVVSVYIFIIMFASGPGSIPWFLVSELFPSNARPIASSIAVSVNWLANFTVSLCFLPISNVLHGFTFFIFAAMLVFFFLFTYYKVPETKGATSEEISALFLR